MKETQMINFNVILFENYEPLDVFGPIEVIGKLDKLYKIEFFCENAGIVCCSQNIKIETLSLAQMPETGVLFIPGGSGTRKEVSNDNLIRFLAKKAHAATYVLTVCTGSALLAKTGVLDQVRATSNKLAFDWAVQQNEKVKWIRKARWVQDGKFYSSSGVSAGIDMTLGFVSDTVGHEMAENIAKGIEYIWNQDKENDPFC
jgi:transcriptional regulator GlxA family with amidase domain